MDAALPRVADAAVQLHGLARDVDRGRAWRATWPSPRPPRRSAESAATASTAALTSLARYRDADEHVGTGVLDGLERADGPAELVTHLHVVDGGGEHRLRQPETVARDRDRRPLPQGSDPVVGITGEGRVFRRAQRRRRPRWPVAVFRRERAAVSRSPHVHRRPPRRRRSPPAAVRHRRHRGRSLRARTAVRPRSVKSSEHDRDPLSTGRDPSQQLVAGTRWAAAPFSAPTASTALPR